MHVTIVGGSLSGLTAAWLCVSRGWSVHLWIRRQETPGPPLVITDLTRDLLLDLWQVEPSIVPALHPLSERVVCLTPGTVRVVAEKAWAMRAGILKATLLDRLRQQVDRRLTIQEVDDPAHAYGAVTERDTWQIDTISLRSGTSRAGRVVAAAAADLRPEARPHQWSFEWIPEGWLFVAPLGMGEAMVQLMTPDRLREAAELAFDRAWSGSTLARQAVRRPMAPHGVWPASPAFADPWPAPRTIRIGEAALAFDPICGDGTGHALRSALLAVAALETIASGEEPASIRAHYRHRLQWVFLQHLRSCLDLYAGSAHASAWACDVADMTRTADALGETLPPLDALPYRLHGTRLLRRAPLDRVPLN